jgi:hypothetical protein
MARFIIGAVIGFLLGTTYPEETRHYAKIFLQKVGQFISTTTKKLDEKRDGVYDEEYPSDTPQKYYKRYKDSNF